MDLNSLYVAQAVCTIPGIAMTVLGAYSFLSTVVASQREYQSQA